MLPQSWTPSWQLRAAGALRSAGTVGFGYAVLWFFFPHVFLVPGTVLIGLLYLPRCLMPARVRLDLPDQPVPQTSSAGALAADPDRVRGHGPDHHAGRRGRPCRESGLAR